MDTILSSIEEWNKPDNTVTCYTTALSGYLFFGQR